jgi:hypothetical protein
MRKQVRVVSEKRELTDLEKRYKRLRWAQWILFVCSIISAILPAVIVAFRVAPRLANVESRVGIAGFAVVILVIGVVLMARGLIVKYREKLPWALLATVGAWILFLLIWSVQKIAEDAMFISLALAIGCSVALIMGAVSDSCKASADGIEQEYHRRQ